MEKKWQEKFNLSDIHYRDWQQSNPKDSFAVWALKNNKITSDQYMDWATQHYNIPFLTDSFFQNISINQQFWHKVQYLEKWNESLIPLYEWNTVLFTGCVKPPEKTQFKNIVPVLALPQKLSFFWNKIKKFQSDSPFTSNDTPNPITLKKPYKENISNTSLTSGKTRWFTKSTNLLNTLIQKNTATSMNKLSENELSTDIFKISEKYFKGVIIFSFHNNEFKPVQWSRSMDGPATPVKINTPSIFSIIVKSSSPYHGYIVKNEQHINFFKPWGFTVLPKHITMIPIFDSSKNIIGAYMGVADKTIQEKYLYEIQKWTKPLVAILQNTKKQIKTSA